MKYIISQNRLENLIDKFISKQIGHLKKYKVNKRYIVWYNPEDGKIVLDGTFNDDDADGDQILISEKNLNPLMVTFNLSMDDARYYFKEWITKNWGIEDFTVALDETDYEVDLGNISMYR